MIVFYVRADLSPSGVMQITRLRANYYLVLVSSASQMKPKAPSARSFFSAISRPLILYFWGVFE